jgi:hypothetical protein
LYTPAKLPLFRACEPISISTASVVPYVRSFVNDATVFDEGTDCTVAPPLFMLGPRTWRTEPGLVVPMPTRPRLFITITFERPAAFEKAKTFPAPVCWTDRALPEAVLPTMKQLDVFKIVGTDGLKLIVFYLEQRLKFGAKCKKSICS